MYDISVPTHIRNHQRENFLRFHLRERTISWQTGTKRRGYEYEGINERKNKGKQSGTS